MPISMANGIKYVIKDDEEELVLSNEREKNKISRQFIAGIIIFIVLMLFILPGVALLTVIICLLMGFIWLITEQVSLTVDKKTRTLLYEGRKALSKKRFTLKAEEMKRICIGKPVIPIGGPLKIDFDQALLIELKSGERILLDTVTYDPSSEYHGAPSREKQLDDWLKGSRRNGEMLAKALGVPFEAKVQEYAFSVI